MASERIVEEVYTPVNPEIYRRFALDRLQATVDNIPTDMPADTCPKCRGWGGILTQKLRRAPMDRKHNRVTIHPRWTRTVCDACPLDRKGVKRMYPILAWTEEVEPDADLLYECGTCGEEKEEEDFPVLITLTCAHEPDTCKNCIQGWVDSQLESGICQISCLATDCKEIMEPADIQRQVTKESYERYLHLGLTQSLSNDETFRYCMNPECDSGQHILPFHETFECDAFESNFCLAHDPMVNHDGESCEEYTARLEQLKRKREQDERDNEASQAEVKRIARECPGCGIQIQKTTGCDHMTCQRCNFEFCYICRASYERINARGNTGHRKKCKWHTNNIRSPSHL